MTRIEGLTRKQKAGLAALAETASLDEAARTAGVAPASLVRWLRRDEFQKAHQDLKKESVTQALSRLQHTSGEAVETIRSIMNDPKNQANVRFTAAKTLLDLALKATELEDLEARITRLENHHKNRNDRNES